MLITHWADTANNVVHENPVPGRTRGRIPGKPEIKKILAFVAIALVCSLGALPLIGSMLKIPPEARVSGKDKAVPSLGSPQAYKTGDGFVSWKDLDALLPGWFLMGMDGKIGLSKQGSENLLLVTAENKGGGAAPSEQLIESSIEGEFQGWDRETIFKLTNGQIWQQDEYGYTYANKMSPKVLVIRTARGWIIQVEGSSKTIKVRRLK